MYSNVKAHERNCARPHSCKGARLPCRRWCFLTQLAPGVPPESVTPCEQGAALLLLSKRCRQRH